MGRALSFQKAEFLQKGLPPKRLEGQGDFVDSRMTSLSWGLRVACAVAMDTGEALWQAWKHSGLSFLDA